MALFSMLDQEFDVTLAELTKIVAIVINGLIFYQLLRRSYFLSFLSSGNPTMPNK